MIVFIVVATVSIRAAVSDAVQHHRRRALSKIDAVQMRVSIEPIRLDVLVSDVTRLMTMRAEEQGIALQVEFDSKLPRVIETDPLRLRQILINLVGNATASISRTRCFEEQRLDTGTVVKTHKSH